MAEAELIELLRSGVAPWNARRPEIVDLSGAKLQKRNLAGINLSKATLVGADLRGADLRGSDLQGADLSDCDLRRADLRRADLTRAVALGARFNEANLRDTKFVEADLSCSDLSQVNGRGTSFRGATLVNVAAYEANFSDARFTAARLVGFDADSTNLRRATFLNADLTQAWLGHSDLTDADMRNANLRGAVLYDSKLNGVNLTSADLSRADLRQCTLVETIVTDCVLSESAIFGVSAWRVRGTPRLQSGLLLNDRSPLDSPSRGGDTRISGNGDDSRKPWPSGRLGISSSSDERMPVDIRVDDLEVAQFVYLLISREKLRNVIETITSKAVLVLGRFSKPRKEVLDAISDELRKNGLIPIIFDFERATTRDLTETVKTLAGLSLFVIADITNPKSAPLELGATVPDYRIPFIPIIQEGEQPFAMFSDLMKYDWVAPPLSYSSIAMLLRTFKVAVIDEAFSIHKRLSMSKALLLETRSVEDYLGE